MLFQEPELEEHELLVIDQINELKKNLAYEATPRRWYGLLRRNAFAKAIRGSNSIEGYVITVDDAIAAVENEEPLDPKSQNWFANIGYRRAMTLVLQKSDAPHFTYSRELLNSLHFMMLDYDLTKNPGNWRTGAIFVRDEEADEVVYEGPDVDAIAGLMSELVDELNQPSSASPLVIQAAMAHLNLVMIHPYSDGNGRMARCLQSLVLARAGTIRPVFSNIEEYLGRNTEEYYAVLKEVGGSSWLPTRNTRPWIRFCLTAHFRQATTHMRRSRYYGRIFEELERIVAQRGLSERSIYALADAALGYKVRNSIYRKTADVSMRAAGRDLKRLVDCDLLKVHGRKRGTFYTAAPDLLKITEKIPRPQRVEDPFEELEQNEMLPAIQATALPI